MNPLKEVKHEKKPLNKINSPLELNLLLIIKPKRNDPTIEIIKLLPINNLKKEMERNMDIIERLGHKTSKLDLKERS